jgi:hypothetical protein
MANLMANRRCWALPIAHFICKKRDVPMFDHCLATWIAKDEQRADAKNAGKMFSGLSGSAMHSTAIQPGLGIFKF